MTTKDVEEEAGVSLEDMDEMLDRLLSYRDTQLLTDNATAVMTTYCDCNSSSTAHCRRLASEQNITLVEHCNRQQQRVIQVCILPVRVYSHHHSCYRCVWVRRHEL